MDHQSPTIHAHNRNQLTQIKTMIAKYHIEYAAKVGRHLQANHFQTDDPIACEEFLVELLERGLKIRAIKHEGVDLPRGEFDKMVRIAACIMAANHVCASLDLKVDEERFRFSFAA
jgi:hypothetical protein